MNLSRRGFVGAAGVALVTGLTRQAFAWPPAAMGFRELRRGVGIFVERGGTIGWLVDAGGVVVVDSQFPDTAADCLAGLQQRSDRAIAALLNTHHHGDHTAGNGVLGMAAERLVAHRRVPELQRQTAAARGTADTETYADTTFETDWVLELEQETVRARHHGPAHTGGDCVVAFERAAVVHMGDLVFNRAYPFVDRAGGASMSGWIGTLEAVAAEHGRDTIFVFGHAQAGWEVTGDRGDLLVQRDLLAAALDHATHAVAAGASREEAVALDRLPAFPDHAPLVERLDLPAVLGAAYDEVSG